MHVQKFGALASPKNFGAKNMQNLGRSYTISDFDHEYLRNEARYPKLERQLSDRERFLPRSAKKVQRTLVHYPESRTCEFGPTHFRLFRETIFRRQWVLAPQIFKYARDLPRVASAHHQRGRISIQNFKGEHLKFGLQFSVLTPITLGYSMS